MDTEFEKQLHAVANGMEYPRTPDIARSVMARLHSFPSLTRAERSASGDEAKRGGRRLAWSLTIILILLSSLMLVPPVRAAIIEFIQIGIVRIFPRPTEPAIDVIRTATPDAALPSLIPMLDVVAGEMKLVNAQQTAPYPILLPTYPSDLGQPDCVYVQDAEGIMTIFVWVDPQHAERVTMSLHLIPSGNWAIKKVNPIVVKETKVNSLRAVWAEGPYPLILHNGDVQFTRLIEGHVLIWEDGDVTYRLETDLPLEEAIKIAESLEPIP